MNNSAMPSGQPCEICGRPSIFWQSQEFGAARSFCAEHRPTVGLLDNQTQWILELESRLRALEKENGRLRDALVEAERLKRLAEREREQLQTQLAGCSVAALGGTKGVAVRGDFGWSASYQDTLDLRRRFDEAIDRLRVLEEENRRLRAFLGKIDELQSGGGGWYVWRREGLKR